MCYYCATVHKEIIKTKEIIRRAAAFPSHPPCPGKCHPLTAIPYRESAVLFMVAVPRIFAIFQGHSFEGAIRTL